ncbi:MAG: transcriptional repressor [Pseudomonadota bacterium]
MTPTQTKILAVLRTADHPLSAYDVLAVLRETQPKAGPPTAYRGLQKLIDAGLAHRLESINAYIACRLDHSKAPTAYAICDDCGRVSEHTGEAITAQLTAAARDGGFEPSRAVVELHGTCRDCRGQSN